MGKGNEPAWYSGEEDVVVVVRDVGERDGMGKGRRRGENAKEGRTTPATQVCPT